MTNTKNSEEKTSKKIRYLMKRMAHNRNLDKSTRIDEENKNSTIGKYFLCKLCVTSQIYLELYKANWIMKLEPQKVQDLISTMALELHKNSKPINCDKFSKITARLPYFFGRITHCSYFIYHFFGTWNFDVLLFSTFL